MQVEFLRGYNMTIVERLRACVGDQTIEEFAAALDEKPQRIKDMLREKQKIPEDFLVKLAIRLGVDLNWLLVGGQEKPIMHLTARESALLNNYRAAAEEGKRALEATSNAVAKPEAVKTPRKKAA